MELSVLLDTNAYSDWRRFGHWNEHQAMADKVLVPIIVLGELLHGFRKGGMMVGNKAKLDTFLREPQVEIISLSRRTADIYGEFLLQLQQQGTPIPTNDIWIAACCYEQGASLLTQDTHFENLPQVNVLGLEAF